MNNLSAEIASIADDVRNSWTRERLVRLAYTAAQLERELLRTNELLDYAVAASAEVEREAERVAPLRPLGPRKLRVIVGGRQ